VNDIESLKRSGRSLCPSDANSKVKEICDVILSVKGGAGIFTEIYNEIGEIIK
jgi:3-deoxy-D-manno-octulosonate 8-phosphate phosphatase KdsC-like HAD superfamily phosphatase